MYEYRNFWLTITEVNAALVSTATRFHFSAQAPVNRAGAYIFTVLEGRI